MDAEELKEALAKKGYVLDKIVRFKHSDRIRWHNEKINVTLSLGKKIELITREQFELYVL